MMRDYFLRASEVAQRASMWEEEIGGSRNRIAFPSDFSDPFDMIGLFPRRIARRPAFMP